MCVFQRDHTQSGWCHEDVFFHPHFWNLLSKNLHDRSHLAALAEPEEAQRPFLATSSGCDGSDCQGSREAKGRCRLQLCVLLCCRLSHRSVADVPCQNGCCRWGQIYIPDRIHVKSVYSWLDTVFFVLPCVLQECGWGCWYLFWLSLCFSQSTCTRWTGKKPVRRWGAHLKTLTFLTETSQWVQPHSVLISTLLNFFWTGTEKSKSQGSREECCLCDRKYR